MFRKFVVLFLITLPIFCFSNEPTLKNNTRSLSGAEVPNISLQQIKTQESKQVGKVEFRKWFFHIYDAKLYTNTGKFDWDKPFLLKIHYFIGFKSKIIVNRTISEIAKQHPKEVKTHKKQYRQIISTVIPDIPKNSNLYGYMDKAGYTYIFSDKKLIGKIKDKELSKYFFEIWLSDKTAHHQLSKKLRGL